MNIEIQGVSNVTDIETVKDVEQTVLRKMQGKQFWLDFAEVFDAWRVVPRTVIFSFGAFAMRVIWAIVHWYFQQPAAQRSVQDATMIAAIFTVLTGFFTTALKFYQDSGRRWDK